MKFVIGYTRKFKKRVNKKNAKRLLLLEDKFLSLSKQINFEKEVIHNWKIKNWNLC